ncbi:putative RNA recognition motif domain, nucleotide-binding alpha-beta plait domain superfamily [Dioscorea sansibarensis]
MRTRDGKSRQFAFVGFRSESEAKEAIDYFDKSYMDTCRITCEVARKVGDPNIPRPWSSHSKNKGSSLDENNKDGSGMKVEKQGSSNVKVKNHNSTENKDPQLQEFLQVMQPRVKSKIWANDTLGEANLVDHGGKTDDEEEQPPKAKKKQSMKKHQSELVHDGSVGASPISQSHEVAQDESTDLDYFKSRVKKNWSDSESDDEEMHIGNAGNENKESKMIAGQDDRSDGSDGKNLDKENPTVPSDDHDSQTLGTNRLFVRNLSYTTDEDELMELFSQFGDVLQVHIVVDKVTKYSKGFAFVHYKLPESATRALEELDQSIFQGRLLHVIPAKAQIVSTDQRSDHSALQDNKNFKQKRKEQRKASETSGDTRAWNSLITHPNTVVENIARKHGISKSELLDREANDLAVRVALGETYVISETKKALSNAGVNINALEESVSKRGASIERSNKIILAKNLPYSTCERDLADMFGKFGSVDKIILPPTRVLALVIFLEASEAAKAFKHLIYEQYNGAVLYLEWAPSNILSLNVKAAKDGPASVVSEENIKSVLLEQSVQGLTEDEIDPDRAESWTIHVKNLNFKTSDEILKKHFSDHMTKGSIRSVKVKTHVKHGKSLSMGFGFIEFDSVDTATYVCRDLQGTVLDGHALILQLSHGKKVDQVLKRDEKDKSSTKLIVRNVAFEATEKDLRQLFSPFGQIKSLRLPTKVGKHRGFAFVEFVTKQEAKNAIQALSSTHLYGRHLVIEQAKARETLEELRARTAAHFVDDHVGFQNQPSKKRKVS